MARARRRRAKKKSDRLIQVTAQADFNAKLVAKTVQELTADLSQARNPLIRGGLLVMQQAITDMRKGGRSIGPRGGLKSTPSPVGKPPHVQTGMLRASINWALTRNILGRTNNVIVGPTRQAAYGKYHEHGIGKFPPRPFMRPALIKVRRKLPALFRDMKLARTSAGKALKAMGRRGKR